MMKGLYESLLSLPQIQTECEECKAIWKAIGELTYDAKLAPLRTLCKKRKLPAYGSKSDLRVVPTRPKPKRGRPATNRVVPTRPKPKRGRPATKARSPATKTPDAGLRVVPNRRGPPYGPKPQGRLSRRPIPMAPVAVKPVSIAPPSGEECRMLVVLPFWKDVIEPRFVY